MVGYKTKPKQTTTLPTTNPKPTYPYVGGPHTPMWGDHIRKRRGPHTPMSHTHIAKHHLECGGTTYENGGGHIRKLTYPTYENGRTHADKLPDPHTKTDTPHIRKPTYPASENRHTSTLQSAINNVNNKYKDAKFQLKNI